MGNDSIRLAAGLEIRRRARFIGQAIRELYNVMERDKQKMPAEKRESRIEPHLETYITPKSELSLSNLQLEAGYSLSDDDLSTEYESIRAHIPRSSKRKSVPANLQYSNSVLEKFRHLMSSSVEALNSFVNSFYRKIYSDPLEAAKDELLRGIKGQSGTCKAVFRLPREIDDYIEKEIAGSTRGNNDRSILGSLLVLCGDSRHCFANSCRTYMKWKWPATADILLDSMQYGPEEERFSE